MATAKRTDPDLWAQVKREVTDGDKGGARGQWSARKAQMAVQRYKARGGGYDDAGPGQDETDLHGWTEDDWGTRSGAASGESGERYLPRAVRMLLTEDEYRRTTARKSADTRGKGDQFSDQPRDVREKVSRIRHAGPTKAMLCERARDLGISGRSRMSKDALLSAIESATDGDGRSRRSAGALRNRTVKDLRRSAREAGIEGRSGMSKDELVRALSNRRRKGL
jgi:hypothetical protein